METNLKSFIDRIENSNTVLSERNPIFLDGSDKDLREAFSEYFYTEIKPGHIYLNLECIVGDFKLADFSYSAKHVARVFNYPDPEVESVVNVSEGKIQPHQCIYLEEQGLSGGAFELVRFLVTLADEGGVLDGSCCTSDLDSRSGYCGSLIEPEVIQSLVQVISSEFRLLTGNPCECGEIAEQALESISPNFQ
jgi:hypothetical protein